MREYYRIANHYIALNAEENSALWNSLPNYAPFDGTRFANANLSRAKLKFISRSQRTMRFAVDNALMLLFAFAGAAEKTLEIHSSVVVNQSKGYAFLGKSGTGKSTHSRLWMELI